MREAGPAPALIYLDGLRALFAALDQTGLTSRELATSKSGIIDPLTPANMTRTELAAAIISK